MQARFPTAPRPWAAGLLAVGLAVSALAADPAVDRVLHGAHAEAGAPLHHEFEFLRFDAGEVGAGRVVKGAPYCADAVHETVQWLPDPAGAAANRIVRQQSTRLCRDGEGRTRQEVARGKRTWVYLRDPVAGENWVLDPERKTARRLGGSRPVAGTDSPEWRDYVERMKEWARSMADRARGAATPKPPLPPMPPMPPAPPEPVVVTRPDGAGREIELHVLRHRADAAGGPPLAELPVPPPGVQWRAQSLAPRGAGTSSPLGTRDIEGVRAHGERTTWTLEAGRIGNEKPIVITREVWTSPELMVTVSSRDFDPRSGEVNYRLQNLRRGEPDPALMKVPADYAKPARPAPRASGPAG